MAVLTSTGEVLPRNVVYVASPKTRSRPQKKSHKRLKIRKQQRVISEQQAQMIMDRQIARKLKRMFY